MTNTQYLKSPVEDSNVKLTHGGAAGVIIGICLVRPRNAAAYAALKPALTRRSRAHQLPFMCICFVWALWYGKKTAGEGAAPVAAKTVEEAPAAPAAEAAPAEAA